MGQGPDDASIHPLARGDRAVSGAGCQYSLNAVVKRLSIVLPFVVAAAGSACFGRSARATPADLVLEHGRIVTVNDAAPEAQALASSGGKIVFVGSNAEVRKYVGGSTKVIDLDGHLAIPGFI